MIQPIQKIEKCNTHNENQNNNNSLTNKYCSNFKISSSPSGFEDILNEEVHKLKGGNNFVCKQT